MKHTDDLDKLMTRLCSCVIGKVSNTLQKPKKASNKEFWWLKTLYADFVFVVVAKKETEIAPVALSI